MKSARLIHKVQAEEDRANFASYVHSANSTTIASTSFLCFIIFLYTFIKSLYTTGEGKKRLYTNKEASESFESLDLPPHVIISNLHNIEKISKKDRDYESQPVAC